MFIRNHQHLNKLSSDNSNNENLPQTSNTQTEFANMHYKK